MIGSLGGSCTARIPEPERAVQQENLENQNIYVLKENNYPSPKIKTFRRYITVYERSTTNEQLCLYSHL